MRMRLVGRFLAAALALAIVPAAAGAGQIRFEDTVAALSSEDAGARAKAAQLLKDAAYPEAAIPLAKAVTDPVDEVQFEAIAAELNIFLAEKIVPKRRVGLVVEVRNPIAAEAAFSAGPSALSGRQVPLEVLNALRTAARDDNPRVGLEALYAFGTLAGEPTGAVRRELLAATGPDVAAMLGAEWAPVRFAAARVLGRVFARRPHDEPIDVSVGDAVITALNDREPSVRAAAMETLGAMRYERSVQALSSLFEYYRKGDMADAAFDALAHIAHPAIRPLVGVQLASKDARLKAPAIEALGRLGDPSGVAAIDEAIRGERDERVLLAAAFATALLSDMPIDRLAEALVRPGTRARATAYLTELAAAGRIGLFTRLLLDPDEHIRLASVEALGLSQIPAARPLVEPLLTDKDAQVAKAAARAVQRLQNAEPRPAS